VECLIILIIVTLKIKPLQLSAKSFKTVARPMIKLLYQTALPVVLNEACWGMANITYTMIYGYIGVHAIATTQITSTVLNLFTIIIFGMAHASVVVIGNEIGANREDMGIFYAKKIIRLALFVGVVMSIVLATLSPFIVKMYNVSEGVQQDAMKILIIYAIFMLPRVYNGVQIVGILRGGGDAKYGSIAQGLSMWLVGIPLAFFAAYGLKWSVSSVIFLSTFEEVLRAFILRRRFKSNKWINNMVEEIA
nr:MATE family efflux transporter [Turicibacter sp.]